MNQTEIAIGRAERPYVDVEVLGSIIDEYFHRKIDHEELKGKLQELLLTPHNGSSAGTEA